MRRTTYWYWLVWETASHNGHQGTWARSFLLTEPLTTRKAVDEAIKLIAAWSNTDPNWITLVNWKHLPEEDG